MYILSRAINEEEYIFYLMDETHSPLKAKIEKTSIGRAIEITREYAKENNTDAWEINSDRDKNKRDSYNGHHII